MTPVISPLHALASALGISGQFLDTLGNQHQASDETVRALVRATGMAADSDTDMRDALAMLEADPFHDIPVARSGSLSLSLPMPVDWWIRSHHHEKGSFC